MTYTEQIFTYDDCTVRVRKPDRTDMEKLKKATERFLKEVIKERNER